MSSARSLFLTALAAAPLCAEEPFDFDATPGKLPKDVVPKRYAIAIEPDIAKAEFHGSESIALEVRRATRRLVLNATGLAVTKATLHSGGDIALRASVDAALQTITFDLDTELPAGACTLDLEFSGRLHERTQGLFITRYQAGGETRRALVTQMESTDARRMFPCWDEPVFRARFGLSVILPRSLTAVSNMPIARESPLAEDRKVVTFADTPPMASYLIALCAGEFEELRDEVEGVELRVLTTAGKREQGRYALEATKKILPFYNEYFGEKYPLPKLDQIAFAVTGPSGMENWGCIVYNDTALLFDPAVSSHSTRERVFAVVAHEIAHQWFGDLVTMAWWDNLWLNEGFASWMGTKATDHFNPGWQLGPRSAAARESAMALDSRATTHPIQQRVDTESQAHDAFDSITYQKGQAFLQMLEGWLGAETFRDGLRAYMQRHAYSSTTTADLWAALESASGKPVRAMAAGWTQQPGFPLVTVARDGSGMRLTQERFTIHQKNPKPLTWQIPVGVRWSGGKSMTLLGAEPATVQCGAAPVVVNADARGYFRVSYPEPLRAALRDAASSLSEADRLGLLNDTWALVEADRLPIARYLDLAQALAGDESYVVADQILGRIGLLAYLERGEPGEEKFCAWARAFLAPQLAWLGWDARSDEAPLNAPLRSSLLRLLGWIEHATVLAEARRRFAAFLERPATLEANLRAPVFAIVGRAADERAYEQLHALARQHDSSEQKAALYGAMCAARDPTLAARTLALALADELPPHDAARLVTRVAQEGAQPALAWDFTQRHLDALLATQSLHGANDYVPAIFRAFLDAARADELEMFAKKNLPPAAGPAVAKAADEIRFKADLKKRVVPGIDAWCEKH